ncbi:CDP-alcohol phosphatidyltransferase family protein [Candidatus Micrarchaeota archaeon]|nr:CDP-alcohol phosphatidyltransferase family protein [Candidatus Micrarchaeota archaeon]
MLKNSSFGKGISELLGKLFGWLPVHPNSLTIASVLLAFLGFLFFTSNAWGSLTSLSFFLFAFFFDALDGAVARAKKLTSKEGAFLDGIADRIVEFFLLLVFLKLFFFNQVMQVTIVSILFFGTCMTSFVKAYAEHKGILKHEEAEKLPGVLERAPRSVILLLALGLFSFNYMQLGIYALYAAAILSVITFAQRFILALAGTSQK